MRNEDDGALLIAGPTASGKSALAMALARRLDALIVNADALQVYRDLRILSARPGPTEEAALPHRLFGHVPSDIEYDVGRYLAEIRPVLAEAAAARRPVVIVGGTGLYFRALTEGLVETPAIDGAIRARWQAAAAAGEDLHARLHALDPEGAARLAPRDLPRLQRALEVIESTGLPLREWQRRSAGAPLLPPRRWRGLFLAPDRAALASRIAARFRAMLAAGVLDEVAALRARGLAPNRGVMKAHGMPHLAAHLAGALALDEAVERSVADTRRYARRQVIWGRKFMADWHWAADAAEAEASLAG